jgi:hypothetical protein
MQNKSPLIILAICCINLLCFFRSSAQTTYYGEEPVKWATARPIKLPADYSKYENEDIVILNDIIEFHFYSQKNEKVVRNVILKINTAKGLMMMSSFKLPESFDPAFDSHFKQGRKSRIKTPYINEFSIKSFAARKFSEIKWAEVPFKLTYEKLRWVRPRGDFAGEFVDGELKVFNFQRLEVGDIVELYYETTFEANYGSNLFYFNSSYPKLYCEYSFIYKVDQRFSDHAFILPVNIPDSLVNKKITQVGDNAMLTYKIKQFDLKGINFPSNSFQGRKLPYVFSDFSFYRILNGSYPDGGSRIYNVNLIRPKNFEWVYIIDTTNQFTKVYDKQFASIRKFVSKLPPVIGPDSTSITFFKAMCDTFNSFRFITSNHLFYNEPNLRDVYSGEHLLKRRTVEHLQWKLYTDILNENKVFYYIANVQDRRYGEHTMNRRICYAYETSLIAVPFKDSYMYFMPRYGGVKYHLNELPFYLEGSIACLIGMNFQTEMKDKEDKAHKFIRTHKGTFNENTRTENSMVKVSLDSLKANLTTKESLSGQFSTLLRHFYLGDPIDSTVSSHYFKKCTDKPGANSQKIKLSSKINDFPFRYSFNCSEKIALNDKQFLDLENWFSFPLSQISIPRAPNHDYYFDFEFSDLYNFMLEFDSPVTIKNVDTFSKTLNNEFFTLESGIVTNSETSYLLKVNLQVKKPFIPYDRIGLLMEMVKELDAINSFSLELVKK